jgi:hypothetical protein
LRERNKYNIGEIDQRAALKKDDTLSIASAIVTSPQTLHSFSNAANVSSLQPVMEMRVKRIFLNDEIHEAYLKLQRSITRIERVAELGAESAKLVLKLSSPTRTRSDTAGLVARRALLAQFNDEHEQLIQEAYNEQPAPHLQQGDCDEQHSSSSSIESPAKRRKSSCLSVAIPEDQKCEQASSS